MARTMISGPTCDEVKVEGDASGKCPWETHNVKANPVQVAGGRAEFVFMPKPSGPGPSPVWTAKP